ncbi:tape measure protein [Limobrevibacterium gyesilva]|uniref:Tape measure protein n=1 Tax=Limobrevibacterium gyesilva TaxID=2991712 RepID=A0AA41YRS5_9PROT|nr:tape measure protein [Limobrevibacterium gyesilva]MCW3477367.1 tape measure protein [Limobrevibacterium gyesilva]
MAQKTFSFRLSADGFGQFSADLRAIAGQGGDAERVIQTLTRSSPQLASAMDAAQAKVTGAANALRDVKEKGADAPGVMQRLAAATQNAQGPVGSLASAFLTGGVFGVGIKAGTLALEKLTETLKQAVVAIPEAGDAYKLISARLEAATGTATLATAVYEKLLLVSRQTGISVQDSAESFTRFAVAAKDVGATSDQVVQLVAGIQKFGIISGLSTTELVNGTRQLAQGLAAGRLQGQDLRATLEDMPQLGAALAAQLGTSIGNLRKMGEEGRLTADTVFPALLRVVQDVDKQFEKMPSNIARSQKAAAAAGEQFLAQLDRAWDISGKIAANFDQVARAMDAWRQFLGFRTATEQQTKALSDLATLDARIAFTKRNLNDLRFTSVFQDSEKDPAVQTVKREVDALVAQRAAISATLITEVQGQIDKVSAEQEQAQTRRATATKSRLTEETEKLRDALDQRYKLQKEHEERIKTLTESKGAGAIDPAEFTRLKDLADKSYSDAIAKLAGSGHDPDFGLGNKDVQSILDRITEHQEAAARQIETALDPAAAAAAKLREEIEKLNAAQDLYARTIDREGGPLGLSPERVSALTDTAYKNFYGTLEKIDDKAKSSTQSFDQFFARATSGFEDAIASGKKFSDVLQGLERDLARLIMREAVTGPLTSALAGAGGIKGLLGSAFNAFFGPGVGPASGSFSLGAGVSTPYVGSIGGPGIGTLGSIVPFANGGIMTSRGALPLHRYAGGGVADRPQLALYGEGDRPEAYVPLPDGRRIPVAMQGGGATTIVQGDTHVHVAEGSAKAPQIVHLVRETVMEQLTNVLAAGGNAAPAAGAIHVGTLGRVAAFADGGIMTEHGPLPLRRYAGGGVADRPQLAMFGEGDRPEAYVPLPDGRRIPVAMQGAGATTIVQGDTHVHLADRDGSAPQIVDLVRETVREQLTNVLAAGGNAAPAAGAIHVGTLGRVAAFADGGIMTSRGALPLHRYAGGGVADRPQLAMFGEGDRPEAYVPLPDGRRIPVAMQGGGGLTIVQGDTNVHVANSSSSPEQIAQMVSMASARSRAELLAEIERGGTVARQVGRRRG